MTEENIIRTKVFEGQKPTKQQIKEIRKASRRPIIPDEDAPELTPEQYDEMAEIARKQRALRRIKAYRRH